jgi:integrase
LLLTQGAPETSQRNRDMADATKDRPALTKRLIDSATYQGDGNSRDVRWDGGKSGVTGLGLRIYPTGRKSFVLSYRTRTGRARMMTLGTYGVVTLEKARTKAKKELVKVTDGEDPMVERKADRKAGTVKELAETYMDRHAKPNKKSWPEDKRRIDRYILPALGSLALKDVTRGDVAALHHKVGKRGKYEANRVLALVSVMFGKAKEWGYLPDDARNPAKGVTTNRERKRDRWVKPAEMPKLAAAIADEPNLYIRAVLWMYLLTGARKSELLPRRWDEVDPDRRELRLPDTKDGDPHTIPLSTAAWAILEQIPRQSGNPHIFCGHITGRHLVNIAKPWRRIRKAAECEDVRLHDLRRTVGSWLATSGASLHLIGAVLNHADTDTTRIYAHLADDATRTALEGHGERIMEAVNGKKKPDPVRAQLRALLDAGTDPADLAATLRALAEQVEGGGA